MSFARGADRLIGIGYLGAHEEAVVFNRSADHRPSRSMVVRDEDSKRGPYGHRTSTVVPCPGAE